MYKRQAKVRLDVAFFAVGVFLATMRTHFLRVGGPWSTVDLSLIHISEPTRPY